MKTWEKHKVLIRHSVRTMKDPLFCYSHLRISVTLAHLLYLEASAHTKRQYLSNELNTCVSEFGTTPLRLVESDTLKVPTINAWQVRISITKGTTSVRHGKLQSQLFLHRRQLSTGGDANALYRWRVSKIRKRIG